MRVRACKAQGLEEYPSLKSTCILLRVRTGAGYTAGQKKDSILFFSNFELSHIFVTKKLN